jgi:TonB family protein
MPRGVARALLGLFWGATLSASLAHAEPAPSGASNTPSGASSTASGASSTASGASNPPPTASSASLVPPRLAHADPVPYPEGATGDHVVRLKLVVNRDGSVRSAEVSVGREPFAQAALDAARGFRFEPATRAGQATAATIHFEVKFVAPAPVEPEAAPPPPPGATPSATPATPVPRPAPNLEVVVQGERPAPAVMSLGRAEVRQLPGAFGDPFRAIEALPGVSPIVSGLPFFYVRGAPPGNVGYFLDGIRVPYLYHVGLGPSIVNPALVERVDLYSGGYPARYGRFVGGIVTGETTEPRKEFHGEGNLRVFDVGGVVETGFAGGRGTVLLGGRYSYTAAVLSLIVDNVRLDYRDYQARVSYDLGPHDRLTAFAFGSYDLLAEEQPGGLAVLFGTEFYRLDLRYDHFYGKGNRVRFAATLGFDQTRLDSQRNAQDKMLSLRTEVTHHLGKGALLRAGVDGVLDAYTADHARYVDPEDPEVIGFAYLFPPRNEYAFGAHADVVLDVARNVELTPGIRADLFQSGHATVPSVDGRLAAKVRVLPRLELIHAFGIAHQPPSFVVPVPGLVPGTLSKGLQTSLQTASGVELLLPTNIKATATLFHNAFFEMSDTLGTSQGNLDPDNLDPRSLGESYGLELYIRRSLTEKLGGSITYNLSRSTRSIGREHFLSAFDRTHFGNIALAYDLGRRWRAGGRFIFYTGIPKRPDVPSGLVQPPRSAHADREPSFYRVDVRLEKKWLIKQTGWLSFVAEMLNATFNKETIGETEIGPVTIPSIGLEGGF